MALRPIGISLLALLAITAWACGSAKATIPPDWTVLTSSTPPMALAIPAGWKARPMGPDFLVHAVAPTPDEGQVGAQVVTSEASDLSGWIPLLKDFCSKHGKNCVDPQLVHLPAGDALRDPSQTMGVGSELEFVFQAQDGKGFVQLLFLGNGTAIPADWDQIAATFNPYTAALP